MLLLKYKINIRNKLDPYYGLNFYNLRVKLEMPLTLALVAKWNKTNIGSEGSVTTLFIPVRFRKGMYSDFTSWFKSNF